MIRLEAPIITQEEYENMCMELFNLEAENENGKNNEKIKALKEKMTELGFNPDED